MGNGGLATFIHDVSVPLRKGETYAWRWPGRACRLWVAIDPHETYGEVEGPTKPARPVQEASGAIGNPRPLQDRQGSSWTPMSGWSSSTKSAYVPVRRLLEDALESREVASLTR